MTPTRDRRPIERVLPPATVEELVRRACAGAEINEEQVAAWDAEFGVGETYGVSRRRLRSFLRRVRVGHEAIDGGGGPPATDAAPGAGGERLQAHRLRQASVAALLEATFGTFDDSNPDLWERRAYLLLVGLVYERLATGEQDIPTRELASLAKILSDGRRGREGGRDLNGRPSCDRPAVPGGPRPDRFADLIREVYGANLAPQTEASSP